MNPESKCLTTNISPGINNCADSPSVFFKVITYIIKMAHNSIYPRPKIEIFSFKPDTINSI
ncbi:MAG: hypothetical protein EPGJADBJ_01944 [Saprospiraceae bacterium]|nr:hypothetical protein [Saprospiraceae bacterium]